MRILALFAICLVSLWPEVLPVHAEDQATKPWDPIIARADIVHSDDNVESFGPTIVRAANGDLIVSMGTRGDGMPSHGIAMNYVRSSDDGRTWSEPYMTTSCDKPLTGVGESLHQLPGGRILRCTAEIVWPAEPDQAKPDYLTICEGRKFDSYYSISEDGGYTFTEKRLLSDPVLRDDFAQGPITELPSGDLIWSWGHWRAQPLNGFKRSRDGGRTWGPVSRAFTDPPPGFKNPLAFNETAVAVCGDQSIIAIARVDGLPDNDKRFWMIRSRDNAQTWSLPRQISIMGGSPALYCTPRGQLWLAYRDGGLGPGIGLAVSDDHGETWRFLYHLKEPKGNHERLYGNLRWTDEDRKQAWRPAEGQVGYPCFARLSDRRVYVVYYAASYPSAMTCYIAGNLLRIPE